MDSLTGTIRLTSAYGPAGNIPLGPEWLPAAWRTLIPARAKGCRSCYHAAA